MKGLLAALCLGLLFAGPCLAQRALTVADLYSLQQIETAALSPDGKTVAAVVIRAGTLGVGNTEGADIWILGQSDHQSRNVTNGAGSGSGSWGPLWSPDGENLAFLSNRDDGIVRLYVLKLGTGGISRVSDDPVDLHIREKVPMLWADNRTLLCAALDPRQIQQSDEKHASESAEQAWRTARAGQHAAVDALESGREIPPEERVQGHLLRIDTQTGSSTEILEGNIRSLSVSPTGRRVSVIVDTGRIPPSPSRKIPYIGPGTTGFFSVRRTRLAMVDLQSSKAEWLDDVIDPSLEDFAHSWSPDGMRFAVIGRRDRDAVYPTTLFVVSSQRSVAIRRVGRRVDFWEAAWTPGGDLMAWGHPSTTPEAQAGAERLDWWLIDPTSEDASAPITTTLKSAPERLFRSGAAHVMLGITHGRLWALDVKARKVHDVTPADASEITAVIWSNTNERFTEEMTPLLIEAANHATYRLSGLFPKFNLQPYSRPSSQATMVDASRSLEQALFKGQERDGTFLWLGNGRERSYKALLSLNQFVAQIDEPKELSIDYSDIDGNLLHAILLMPPNYVTGKRYPVVSWVYGGAVLQDYVDHGLFNTQQASSLNLKLLPAHGYALLIPSMPLSAEGEPGDPMIDLPKGALAAIDKVVTLGLADPSRLGVMGHSYGGYSTYSILVYTRRFAAGISLAGPADLTSLYGELDPRIRYERFAHERAHTFGLMESGQDRMGAAPWRDLLRYVRNSPYYFVDRIHTPLMIIQGDLDYVPIQQGEEMFSALYRLGRPAKFVRYWNEGHVIERSRANVEDMWQRVFNWFDKYLCDGKPPTGEGCGG